MKVLLVGSGGREHALAWALSRSPGLTALWCAPGSDAIASLAGRAGDDGARAAAIRCVPVAASDVAGLAALVAEERFDLVVIGPEQPLAAGLTDRLEALGIPVMGPTRAAADLEASKIFAKEVMAKAGVATARYEVHEALGAALKALEGWTFPLVVKADGLAAGKGVVIAADQAEAEEALRSMLEARSFGDAGQRVILEAFLAGEELSYLVLTDGERVLPLGSAQDHKRVFDGDEGPNTGGMGVVSPTPLLTPALEQEVLETVIHPVLRTLKAAGTPFRGVLFAGLMIVDGRPYVLEFNARFGDPETQALMMRLDSDLLPVLLDVALGRLGAHPLSMSGESALCVVMASAGYPGPYRSGLEIRGLDAPAARSDVQVFHAGTRLEREGGRERFVTSGGRVLAVTARGPSAAAAAARAYARVSQIHFEGAHFRTDIGARALRQKG